MITSLGQKININSSGWDSFKIIINQELHQVHHHYYEAAYKTKSSNISIFI